MNEIKPLREFINDKKGLIDEMFSCVEEHQLKKMIPDVLKEANTEDIKAECLVELFGMSRKRILAILEGKELDESSEDSLELSDISEDEIDIKEEIKSPEKNKKRRNQKSSKGIKSTKKLRQESSSESEPDEKEESEKEVTPPKKKRPEPKKKKKAEQSTSKQTSPKKTVKASKKKSEEGMRDKEKLKEKQSKVAHLEEELEIERSKEKVSGGKNLLEILELEMRARAIRSLIQREEKKNSDKSASPKPSISDTQENDADNDPDAVIVIDETAEEIDLTVDDSDAEEPRTVSDKDKNKPVESKEKSESSNDDDLMIIGDKETENNESKITEISSKVNNPVKKQKEFNLRSGQRFKHSDSSKSSLEAEPASNEFIPKNWTERWLESNEVQNVMKTTKVLTNLKKRLKSVNKQRIIEEKNSGAEEQKVDKVIEGTVDEYSQLPSKRKGIDDGKDNGSDTTQDEPDKNKTDSSPNINVDKQIYKVSLDKLPLSSDKSKTTQESDNSIATPQETTEERSSSETEEKEQSTDKEKPNENKLDGTE